MFKCWIAWRRGRKYEAIKEQRYIAKQYRGYRKIMNVLAELGNAVDRVRECGAGIDKCYAEIENRLDK